MFCVPSHRTLLALVAALAVFSVVAGVSVRVTSETTPEGTTATVNGKRVEPGEWADGTGRGSFQKTDHSSHVEYSSSSATGSSHASGSARTYSGSGGEGWSSGDEDEGEHCSYDAVTMTQKDGEEPVITRTHKEGCGSGGADAAGDGEKPKKKKLSKFDKMMRRRRASAFATLQQLEESNDPLQPPKMRDYVRGTSKAPEDIVEGDWDDSKESRGGGVEKDWGNGMKASARGVGDNVRESVAASSKTNADGTESKRVSASASASSSSSARKNE